MHSSKALKGNSAGGSVSEREFTAERFLRKTARQAGPELRGEKPGVSCVKGEKRRPSERNLGGTTGFSVP